MRLSKREIEERLKVLSDELIDAELMDLREKYYELVEEQITLLADLHYGNYAAEPQFPACHVCGRRSRSFRQLHEERGDSAVCWILCPTCIFPMSRSRKISQ